MALFVSSPLASVDRLCAASGWFASRYHAQKLSGAKQPYEVKPRRVPMPGRLRPVSREDIRGIQTVQQTSAALRFFEVFSLTSGCRGRAISFGQNDSDGLSGVIWCDATVINP